MNSLFLLQSSLPTTMTDTVTQPVVDAFQKFRVSRSPFGVLILRVNRQTQQVELDDGVSAEGIQTFADLRKTLPEAAPRFVLLSLKVDRGDGRVSYPLALVFYSPAGGNTQLSMMYTRLKHAVTTTLDLTHVLDFQDKDDITEEALSERCAK
eukprot:ANDGO_01421.mRNA.1 Actin-depolymerizing factor gmf1